MNIYAFKFHWHTSSCTKMTQDGAITIKASGITRLLYFFIIPNCESKRDYETVALFRTTEQDKRVGLRDCYTFSYFRTRKASGNTRLLHFFVHPDHKSERDYETVALFRTSGQQKRAGSR